MQPSQPTPLDTATRLRPAHDDDVAAVAAVWESGWSDGHRGHVPVELEAHRTRSAFTRLAGNRIANTVLAVDNGVVVGFIVVADDELEQMYVAASHRGLGVADLLISHAEAIIGERYATCWLAVASGNARARRFYERSGWIDAGPLDYRAEIDGGHIEVPTHRYEKQIASPQRSPRSRRSRISTARSRTAERSLSLRMAASGRAMRWFVASASALRARKSQYREV